MRRSLRSFMLPNCSKWNVREKPKTGVGILNPEGAGKLDEWLCRIGDIHQAIFI